jgi:cell division protein FtsB
MNAPRQPKKSNPTTRVAVLIVVIVLIVIGTLAYNAIKGKLDYEEQNAAAASSAVAASAPAASR